MSIRTSAPPRRHSQPPIRIRATTHFGFTRTFLPRWSARILMFPISLLLPDTRTIGKLARNCARGDSDCAAPMIRRAAQCPATVRNQLILFNFSRYPHELWITLWTSLFSPLGSSVFTGFSTKCPFPRQKSIRNKINNLPSTSFHRSGCYKANSYKFLQQGISQQASRKPQAFYAI
jgi:hypothetical protein